METNNTAKTVGRSIPTALPIYGEPPERKSRPLSLDEQRIRKWIKSNYGVISEVAKQLGLSIQFVHRVAYNREAKSKDLRVEKALRARGCPLIQRL